MTDCIPWWGAIHPSGYGVWPSSGGRSQRRRPYAHRVIYEETIGPIPEGLTLDHLCRNRACVNPAHLEPVTNRENILRGTSPPARRARQTSCDNGHSYGADNLYVWGGYRYCRKCRAEYAKRRRTGPRTVCRNGHPYTPENVYWNPVGFRVCLTCRRGWGRRLSLAVKEVKHG